MSTALSHPRLMIEPSVQTEILRTPYVTPNMTDWDQHLCLAQFAMKTAWHETIQQILFSLESMADHPRVPWILACLTDLCMIPLLLANLHRDCSSWLQRLENSLEQLNNGISVTVMLSIYLPYVLSMMELCCLPQV